MSRTFGLAFAAVAVVVVVAAVAVTRPAAETTEGRVAALAAGLRCPDCQGLSVAESHSASAAAIQAEIARLVGEGRSDDEIRSYFVARYGDWILLAPAWIGWWIAPFGVAAIGLLGLVAWLRRGRHDDAVALPPHGSNGIRERVREEAESLDA